MARTPSHLPPPPRLSGPSWKGNAETPQRVPQSTQTNTPARQSRKSRRTGRPSYIQVWGSSETKEPASGLRQRHFWNSKSRCLLHRWAVNGSQDSELPRSLMCLRTGGSLLYALFICSLFLLVVCSRADRQPDTARRLLGKYGPWARSLKIKSFAFPES